MTSDWSIGDPVQFHLDRDGTYIGWVDRFGEDDYSDQYGVWVRRPENHIYFSISRTWWARPENLVAWLPPS